MVGEILLGVFLLLSFLVVLTTQRLILRKIRMLILDFPRLDHDKVLNTRKEQSAVPQGFETWNWKTEEVHSPWRGPMTLEWTSGEIPCGAGPTAGGGVTMLIPCFPQPTALPHRVP